MLKHNTKINIPECCFNITIRNEMLRMGRVWPLIAYHLLVSQGMSCFKFAEALGDLERTIRYWVKMVNDEGLQLLIENRMPVRTSQLTNKEIKRIDGVLRKYFEILGWLLVYWRRKHCWYICLLK